MFLDRCWYLEVKMKLFHIFLQGNFYQDTPLNCKIYFSSYWFLIQIGTRKVREQCEDLIGLGSLSEWVIGVMTFALNSDTVLLHDVSYFTCLFGTCCALYISILQAVERPDEHQPLTTDCLLTGWTSLTERSGRSLLLWLVLWNLQPPDTPMM